MVIDSAQQHKTQMGKRIGGREWNYDAFNYWTLEKIVC
jgi:hypothetical protein